MVYKTRVFDPETDCLYDITTHDICGHIVSTVIVLEQAFAPSDKYPNLYEEVWIPTTGYVIPN